MPEMTDNERILTNGLIALTSLTSHTSTCHSCLAFKSAVDAGYDPTKVMNLRCDQSLAWVQDGIRAQQLIRELRGEA